MIVELIITMLITFIIISLLVNLLILKRLMSANQFDYINMFINAQIFVFILLYIYFKLSK